MKKVFQIKLKNITKVFALVIAVSLVTFTGCKSYDEDIANLETEIAALKTELTTLNTTTKAATDAQIAALTTEINTLKTKVSTLETSGATDAEVAAAIAAAKTDILSKTATLEAFNAYKTTNDAAVAALTTKVNAAATKVDLDAAKADLNTQINAVKTTLTNLGADVTAINTKVTGLTADVAKLTTDLGKVKGDLEARLAIVEGLLVIQNGKSTVLDGFTTKLADQLALITANKAAITALQTTLTAEQAKIVTLQADVAKAKTDITALQTAVTALQASVKQVNDNLKVIASAMSLNFEALSSRLTSLTYVPEFYVNGIEAMNFSSFISNCGVITPEVTVAYHLNPSFITPADIETANLGFVVIESQNMITGYASAKAAETRVKATFKEIKDGKIYVNVSVVDFNTLLGAAGGNIVGGSLEKFHSIALQIPLSAKAITENQLTFNDADGTVTVGTKTYPAAGVITAQYVRLYHKARNHTEFGIARKLSPANILYPTTLGNDGDYLNQATSQLGTAKGLKTQYTVDQDGITAVLDPLVISIPYNSDPATLYDLSTLGNPVVVLLTNLARLYNDELPAANYGTWSFKFDEKYIDSNNVERNIVYNRGGNATDQQQFIEFTADGKMKRIVYTQGDNGAAIGRTPVVRIRAYNSKLGDCPVYTAYTKLWLEQKPRPDAISVDTTFASTVQECNDWSGKTTVPWMNIKLYNKVKLSKEAFHGMYELKYKVTSHDGTVTEIIDPMNQDSYVLQWTLTAQEIWAKLSTLTPGAAANFSIDMIYTPKVPEEYPVINIKLNKTFTRPAYLNIEPADLIKEYWYNVNGLQGGEGVFEAVKHNVRVPNVGENVSDSCIFENNINQAFEQRANKYLKNITGYKYHFLRTQLPDGTWVDPNPSNDQELMFGGVVIAKIRTHTDKDGDVLELINNTTTNTLLNKNVEFLKVYIKIDKLVCENIPLSNSIVTIAGKDRFLVRFIRPISAKGNAGDYFVDALNFGEAHTYLEVKNLVGLVDWRDGIGTNGVYNDSKFSTHPYYWGYYDIKDITVKTEWIRTDLNQTGATQVLITQYPDLRVAVQAIVNGNQSTYKYLTYNNTGNTVGKDFNLYVPVIVTYKWGQIIDAEVVVAVKKTVGPSSVKSNR